MQHDSIVIDRSGSMRPRWAETLSAVNGYIDGLRKQNVDTTVTVAAFDQQSSKLDYLILRDRVTPGAFENLREDEVSPRGYTPLNDAVARCINDAKAGNYERVAVIIVTDGIENASTEYKDSKLIKTLLDECRAKNWQIIFIGADFDNWAQASNYGNSRANTVQVSTANMGKAFSNLSGTRASYGLTGQSMGLSDSIRDELKKTNN